jgi:alpha-tubulin suppressor-like RCC1 family protein
MLGLGSSVVSTGGKACRVFLDPTIASEPRIIDFKVGTNHALALTDDGRVFGWG